jgi:choline dehydrogenase-like flavoprotein
LTGWFNEWTRVMRLYNHLAVCGMVVPTGIRATNFVTLDGKLRLELSNDEFELLLRGMEKIGRIYLAGATAENGVSLHLATKAVLLDASQQPLRIRDESQLMHAIGEIRRRGPAFLSLATAHPQGGNSLGSVVNPATFKVMVDGGADIENLYVADASIFPAGCEVNPQLTINALAHCAADRILAAAEGNQS